MPPSTPLHPARFNARPPYAGPGQAIGLLGGSFNPPHVAHKLISEAALKRLGLDKVWWIVSPGNPLKQRTPPPSLAERMRLCRTVATNPHIVVTDFEADLPTPYAVSTLAFLKARSPLTHFVWIMGADNLAQFHRWKDWRRIASEVPIAVIDRPPQSFRALAAPAAQALARYRLPENQAVRLTDAQAPAWVFLTGMKLNLSSTRLRNSDGSWRTM